MSLLLYSENPPLAMLSARIPAGPIQSDIPERARNSFQ